MIYSEPVAHAINLVAREMYQIAADHGFHNESSGKGHIDLVTVDRMAKFCTNLHGEVSELWEAARKGQLDKPCDKEGCDLTSAEEELADIVIRAMDTAVELGVDLGKAILQKAEYNSSRPYMHGKKA